MAIKGKGKTRRRTVTAGPKPVYVQPPKPFWRKRWFRVGVIAIVVAGIAAGATAALIAKHHRDVVAAKKRERALEQTLFTSFDGTIRSAIQPISTPTADTFTLFPSLTQALSAFKGGSLDVKGATQESQSDVSHAKQATTAILAKPAATVVSGHPDLLPLIRAQQDILSALQVYQQAAIALGSAATATGADRDAFITQAQSLVQAGGTLFLNAYQDVINVETSLGITPQIQQPVPPTAPPVQPSATTKPSAKASPTAKAKGSPKPTASPKASPSAKRTSKPKASASPSK